MVTALVGTPQKADSASGNHVLVHNVHMIDWLPMATMYTNLVSVHSCAIGGQSSIITMLMSFCNLLTILLALVVIDGITSKEFHVHCPISKITSKNPPSRSHRKCDAAGGSTR